MESLDLKAVQEMEKELRHIAILYRCDIFQVADRVEKTLVNIRQLEEEESILRKKSGGQNV
jgi:hypothetical protein